jgi:hypothetical protein
VKIEPAEIFEENGTEMRLVTVAISNQLAGPFAQEKILYLRDGIIETKVAERWSQLKGSLATLGSYALGPGQKNETLLLVSGDAIACRIRPQCTRGVFETGNWNGFYKSSSKRRLSRLAGRLPIRVRCWLPAAFWRWVGFIGYGPSPDWRDFCVELPLPSTATVEK